MRTHDICYRVLVRDVPEERRKVEKIRKNVEAIRRCHNIA